MKENGEVGKQAIGTITIVNTADGQVTYKLEGQFNIPAVCLTLDMMKLDFLSGVKQQQMMQAMQGVQIAGGPIPPFRK